MRYPFQILVVIFASLAVGCNDVGETPARVVPVSENVENLCRLWRGSIAVSIVYPDSLAPYAIGEVAWKFDRDASLQSATGEALGTWTLVSSETHLVLRYRSGREEEYSITELSRHILRMQRSYSQGGDSLFADAYLYSE